MRMLDLRIQFDPVDLHACGKRSGGGPVEPPVQQGGDTEAFWPPVQQNHGHLPVQENADAYVISFFS